MPSDPGLIPGGQDAQAFGINASDTLVGLADTGTGGVPRGFAWTQRAAVSDATRLAHPSAGAFRCPLCGGGFN